MGLTCAHITYYIKITSFIVFVFSLEGGLSAPDVIALYLLKLMKEHCKFKTFSRIV